MRTNIVLDDDLILKAIRLGGYKTKKGAIEDALRLLIQVKAQEKLRGLRGKVAWTGDLDRMRIDG